MVGPTRGEDLLRAARAGADLHAEGVLKCALLDSEGVPHFGSKSCWEPPILEYHCGPSIWLWTHCQLSPDSLLEDGARGCHHCGCGGGGPLEEPGCSCATTFCSFGSGNGFLGPVLAGPSAIGHVLPDLLHANDGSIYGLVPVVLVVATHSQHVGEPVLYYSACNR